jgi:hypothetical protein
MKRYTIIIIVFIIVFLLVVPIGLWYLASEKPIKAKPNELLLSSEELSNWVLVEKFPAEGYDVQSIPKDMGGGYMETAMCNFFNSSVKVGERLSIWIDAFNSTNQAQGYFADICEIYGPMDSTSLKLGDEGGRWPTLGGLINDANGNSILIELTNYNYREANVMVSLCFWTYGTKDQPLDPNGIYYEPWMDDIAIQQMSKIDSFNTHIF